MDTPSVPRMVVLVILIAAVIGSIFYLNSQKVERGRTEAVTIKPRTSSEPNAASSTRQNIVAKNKDVMPSKFISAEEKAKRYELAKEITTPNGFINTLSTSSGQATPVTIGEFVGKKVVLLDIWTYSCINCQRTTPYLNSWYEKYKNKGLVIIGLHTPEFEFEKVYQNVLEATKRMEIKYPVVLDNDYSTWNAYKNRFWPRKYLIDIDGYVVYDHIGEGGYEETERKIQELLSERMNVLDEQGSIATDIAQPVDVVKVDPSRSLSRETYFGSGRNEFLGNGSRGVSGPQTFVVPARVDTGTLYLVGDWDMVGEYAEARSADAKIIYRYQGKVVNIVLSNGNGDELVISRDGEKLGSWAGSDVTIKNGEATSVINRDDQFNIVKDPAGYGEHTIEITIKKPGLRVHAFTFG